MIKVGIIGSGWIAVNRHIPSLKKDPRVTITAIADHHIERAREVAGRFHIPKYYKTIDEIPEKEVDVLTICTTPWTHGPLTIQALEKGWHVLTEKPMAMSVEEADRMIDAAKNSGLKLGVCHNFLFSRSMNKAKTLMRNGETGNVIAVLGLQLSSSRRRLPDWYSNLPGGLFYDESPHMIYLMQHFVGSFKNVRAVAYPLNGSKNTLDRMQATFDSGDKVASLDMIFESPISDWILTVICENRVMYIDVFRDILISKRADVSHKPSEILQTSFSSIFQDFSGILSSGINLVRGNLLFGHEVLISGFIDSVTSNKQPLITGEDGRQVVEVIWNVIKSSGLK